jgi:hypothetical protein
MLASAGLLGLPGVRQAQEREKLQRQGLTIPAPGYWTRGAS